MILWLNPFSGVSGDMLLGALLGLGAPLDGVRAAVRSTGVEGWELAQTVVSRGGLVATRAVVTAEHGTTDRRAAELLKFVGRARPAPIAALAARAVHAIAEVEADLHGVPVDAVHLHEIGGIDTVVDTVGVAAALHLLRVTAVHCDPLGLGSGQMQTRHGTLPLPAPATAALLARAGAAIIPIGAAGETVTPTGAALLLAAGTQFGAGPPMNVRMVGYGAGGREIEGRPNVLQAVLGSRPMAAVDAMLLLETNVDDVTGELLGHLIIRLLSAGAADAWVTPIVMKKGRPAHTVSVLVSSERASDCERIVLEETGSLGLRRIPVERLTLRRRTSTVDLSGHPIRIKHGPWGAKPEHDDVAAAAEAMGLPLRVVAKRARSLVDDGLEPD